ncbi:MAG: ABC transporter substrate-binding protein [Candidatus Odinarchaeota archaeon]
MQNKKKIGSIVIIVALAGMISGIVIFSYYLNTFEGDRTITDFLGREIKVPQAADIDRIVGVNPGCLRLLVYIGAEDLVCGVEDIERLSQSSIGRPYLYAHPELSNLPSIGPQFGGDPELILGQKPDMIFITYGTIEEANTLQVQTGVPVVALGYGEYFGDLQLDYFYDSLDLLGNILDKQDRAIELKNYINQLITDLGNRTKNIAPGDNEWIYVGGIGHQGVHGIASTDCQYEPLEYINGNNTASLIEGCTGHAFINTEQLFQWESQNQLDYILVDAGGYGLCLQDLQNKSAGGVGLLNCIQDNPPHAIMTLPYNYYTTNLGTVFADAYYLGKRFFPEEFSDLNYSNGKIYDDIYEKFVGKGVYMDIENDFYGGFHNITRTEIDDYGST